VNHHACSCINNALDKADQCVRIVRRKARDCPPPPWNPPTLYSSSESTMECKYFCLLVPTLTTYMPICTCKCRERH
jgi:hypothetical protein